MSNILFIVWLKNYFSIVLLFFTVCILNRSCIVINSIPFTSGNRCYVRAPWNDKDLLCSNSPIEKLIVKYLILAPLSTFFYLPRKLLQIHIIDSDTDVEVQILSSNLVYLLNLHLPPSIPFFAYAINSKFPYQRLQPVYRRIQGKKDRSQIAIFTVGCFLKQTWNGYLKRIRKERRNFKLALSSLRNVAERISSRSSMQQACICAIERGWCRCNWQPCRAVCQPRLSAGSRVYRTSFQLLRGDDNDHRWLSSSSSTSSSSLSLETRLHDRNYCSCTLAKM